MGQPIRDLAGPTTSFAINDWAGLFTYGPAEPQVIRNRSN